MPRHHLPARLRCWLFAALSCALVPASALPFPGLPAATRSLPVEAVLQVEPASVRGGQASLALHIATDHYVYLPSLELLDADGRRLPLQQPDGETIEDAFFGRTSVLRGGQPHPPLSWPLSAAYTAPLTLHWQGCAEAGICYPPQRTTLDVDGLPAPAPLAGMSAPMPAQAPALEQPVATTAALPTQAPSTAQAAQPAAPATPAAPSQTPAPSPPLPASPAPDSTMLSSADNSEAAAAPTPTLPALAAPPPGSDQALAGRLAQLSLGSALLLFFGLGLLLAFTPCTLPMIPIVSSLIVGQATGTGRAVGLSLTYVASMALTYAVAGVVAGLAGASVQAALQSPAVLSAFAVLFVLLAGAQFGLYPLRLPTAISAHLDRGSQRIGGGGLLAAAALGLLSALLVGPCMTAPLAGALLYIGNTGSAFHGGAVLFALGLRMGLPLVAIATFGARILPRPGPWMQVVNHLFGYVLLALAVSMLGRFLPASIALILWGSWLLAVATGLLGWASIQPAWRRWAARSLAAPLLVWSVLMLGGAAAGGTSPWQPLPGAKASTAVVPLAFVRIRSQAQLQAQIDQAVAAGRWSLVDVYADWCVSCHVIEREVFADPRVAARLAGLQRLRPDVTANNADDRELLTHWEIAGPPTLLLIGPDGQERRALRMVGPISAEQFLARLDQAGIR